MSAAALRTSRDAARNALRDPAPFALALPLAGVPGHLARSLLRATSGVLQNPGVVVASDGAWTLRVTTGGSAVLLTPLLTGAAGLARLQQVIRVLRVDGAVLAHAPISVFVEAPLDPHKLSNLHALCVRQLPFLEPATKATALPPSRRIEAARKRLDRVGLASRWLDCARVMADTPVACGLDVRPLLAHGLVSVVLEAKVLHSGEITALVQIAVGLVHRARVARAVARTPRPTSSASARYDLRVALLYLGFVGPDFRTQREQLLQRATGSAAWKHGANGRVA